MVFGNILNSARKIPETSLLVPPTIWCNSCLLKFKVSSYSTTETCFSFNIPPSMWPLARCIWVPTSTVAFNTSQTYSNSSSSKIWFALRILDGLKTNKPRQYLEYGLPAVSKKVCTHQISTALSKMTITTLKCEA